MVWHPDYGSAPVQARPHIRGDNGVWTNYVPVLPPEKWCVFKDALGEPIPEATVEIFEGSNWEKRSKVAVEKAVDRMKGDLEKYRTRFVEKIKQICEENMKEPGPDLLMGDIAETLGAVKLPVAKKKKK